MKKSFFVLLSFLIVLSTSCDTKSHETGRLTQVKEGCFSASDERSYQEMTGYLVLKDDIKIKLMIRLGKVNKLGAGKRVRILKKKIDIAHIEYSSEHGKRKGWIALKNLK